MIIMLDFKNLNDNGKAADGLAELLENKKMNLNDNYV